MTQHRWSDTIWFRNTIWNTAVVRICTNCGRISASYPQSPFRYPSGRIPHAGYYSDLSGIGDKAILLLAHAGECDGDNLGCRAITSKGAPCKHRCKKPSEYYCSQHKAVLFKRNPKLKRFYAVKMDYKTMRRIKPKKRKVA